MFFFLFLHFNFTAKVTMKVKEIKSAEEFRKEVEEAQGPCVVDFFATWCGPCRVVAPVLEDLAAQYEGKVRFFKVDVDNLMEVASRFRITGVPTIVYFKDGKEAGRTVGAASRDYFREKINSVFGL